MSPVMPAFDTLKYANALKDVGIPDRQAEAQALALSGAFDVSLERLATKDDLNLLATELRGENKITKWMLGTLIVAVGAMLKQMYFH
ncbi:MAG TPA: DUF1640 domain-containing protein [Bordetella sp.]